MRAGILVRVHARLPGQALLRLIPAADLDTVALGALGTIRVHPRLQRTNRADVLHRHPRIELVLRNEILRTPGVAGQNISVRILRHTTTTQDVGRPTGSVLALLVQDQQHGTGVARRLERTIGLRSAVGRRLRLQDEARTTSVLVRQLRFALPVQDQLTRERIRSRVVAGDVAFPIQDRIGTQVLGLHHVDHLTGLVVGLRQVQDRAGADQIRLREVEAVVDGVLAVVRELFVRIVTRAVLEVLAGARGFRRPGAQPLGLLVGHDRPGALRAVGLRVGLQEEVRARGGRVAVQHTAVGRHRDHLERVLVVDLRGQTRHSVGIDVELVARDRIVDVGVLPEVLLQPREVRLRHLGDVPVRTVLRVVQVRRDVRVRLVRIVGFEDLAAVRSVLPGAVGRLLAPVALALLVERAQRFGHGDHAVARHDIAEMAADTVAVVEAAQVAALVGIDHDQRNRGALGRIGAVRLGVVRRMTVRTVLDRRMVRRHGAQHRVVRQIRLGIIRRDDRRPALELHATRQVLRLVDDLVGLHRGDRVAFVVHQRGVVRVHRVVVRDPDRKRHRHQGLRAIGPGNLLARLVVDLHRVIRIAAGDEVLVDHGVIGPGDVAVPDVRLVVRRGATPTGARALGFARTQTLRVLLPGDRETGTVSGAHEHLIGVTTTAGQPLGLEPHDVADLLVGPPAALLDLGLRDDHAAAGPDRAVRDLSLFGIALVRVVHRTLGSGDSPEIVHGIRVIRRVVRATYFVVAVAVAGFAGIGLAVAVQIRADLDRVARLAALGELARPGDQDLVALDLEHRLLAVAVVVLAVLRLEGTAVGHARDVLAFPGVAVVARDRGPHVVRARLLVLVAVRYQQRLGIGLHPDQLGGAERIVLVIVVVGNARHGIPVITDEVRRIAVRPLGGEPDTHDVQLRLGAGQIRSPRNQLAEHRSADRLAEMPLRLVLVDFRQRDRRILQVAVRDRPVDHVFDLLIVGEIERLEPVVVHRELEGLDGRRLDDDPAVGAAVVVQALQQTGHVDDTVVIQVARVEDVQRGDLVVGVGLAQLDRTERDQDFLAGEVVELGAHVGDALVGRSLDPEAGDRRVDEVARARMSDLVAEPPAPAAAVEGDDLLGLFDFPDLLGFLLPLLVDLALLGVDHLQGVQVDQFAGEAVGHVFGGADEDVGRFFRHGIFLDDPGDQFGNDPGALLFDNVAGVIEPHQVQEDGDALVAHLGVGRTPTERHVLFEIEDQRLHVGMSFFSQFIHVREGEHFLVVEMTDLGIAGRSQRRQIILAVADIDVIFLDAPAVGRFDLDVQLVARVPDAAGANIDVIAAGENAQCNSTRSVTLLAIRREGERGETQQCNHCQQPPPCVFRSECFHRDPSLLMSPNESEIENGQLRDDFITLLF